MRDINDITLTGTIGQGFDGNPPVRYVEGVGKKNSTVANFTIIPTKPSLIEGGDPWKTYIKVAAWNDLSQVCVNFQEGQRVMVKGEIQNESYEKKDGSGTKVNTLTVRAWNVEALDAPGPQPEGQQQQYVAPPVQPPQQPMQGPPPQGPTQGQQIGAAFQGGGSAHDDGLPF